MTPPVQISTGSRIAAYGFSRKVGLGQRLQLTVTALRSFCGFLHLEGVLMRSLVPAVPTVTYRHQAGLPKGLEPEEVRRILTSCDTASDNGVRDLAILTLLVRLGLRRCEVSRLGLDDIDWRAGTICVHGKGNCLERLPLPVDVGHYLAQYLRHARPAKARVAGCPAALAAYLRFDNRRPRIPASRATARPGPGP